MIFRLIVRSEQIRTLLELHKPLQYLKKPSHCDHINTQIKLTHSHDFYIPFSIFRRPISISSQFIDKMDVESVSLDNIQEKSKKTRKPLVVLFEEAVGLSQKVDDSEGESESGSDDEIRKLKRKLRKLEIEVRNLNEDEKKKNEEIETRVSKMESNLNEDKKKQQEGTEAGGLKAGSLSSIFVKGSKRKGAKRELESKEEEVEAEETVYKKLPTDIALFADHLYNRGYFEKANFLRRGSFDATSFEHSYARNFLRYAVDKFAKENQQITQWLSSSDLKTVAQFGCPTLGRKTIFSAKALRVIFKIKEDTVCGKCVLNKKCKFVNQSVWKTGSKNLDLAGILRVITLYALESTSPELVVPEEVKKSVSQLLKDILHQSQNI